MLSVSSGVFAICCEPRQGLLQRGLEVYFVPFSVVLEMRLLRSSDCSGEFVPATIANVVRVLMAFFRHLRPSTA